jgi:5-methylcytosine-specific restriction endonuclease McrA
MEVNYMRTCNTCGGYKESEEFRGSRHTCRQCENRKNSAWKAKNKERVAIYAKTYKELNKEKAKQIRATRRKTENAAYRKRYAEDSQFRLSVLMRANIRQALRKNRTRGKYLNSLGCTISELRFYLETMFRDGMSWDNYGEWHIDHIVPISSFDLTSEVEFSKAIHYTNLQPLWVKENYEKYNKEDAYMVRFNFLRNGK